MCCLFHLFAYSRPYLRFSATYILGPLKSRLSREMGTSNTEFGLLLAALSLSGTWTPLVGGLMAARLGTTVTSIIATGTVFLGGHPQHLSVDLLTLLCRASAASNWPPERRGAVDDSWDVYIWTGAKPVVRSVTSLESTPTIQLKFYSQLHKKPSSYDSSSRMDLVYLSVCIILRSRKAPDSNGGFSSRTCRWERGLLHLSAHIIPSLTVVSKFTILRFHWCHRLLIRH